MYVYLIYIVHILCRFNFVIIYTCGVCKANHASIPTDVPTNNYL